MSQWPFHLTNADVQSFHASRRGRNCILDRLPRLKTLHKASRHASRRLNASRRSRPRDASTTRLTQDLKTSRRLENQDSPQVTSSLSRPKASSKTSSFKTQDTHQDDSSRSRPQVSRHQDAANSRLKTP
jgi:hypothetical protein